MLRRALSLLLVLVLVLVPSLGAALEVRDQSGRRLSLPRAPRRIVSLVPSVTETLFAIGAQDVLVGVTDFCDYPPAARAKPSIGGMLSPSLETVITLKPDLVVATNAGNREETFLDLGRLKIPLYIVNPTSLADVFDLITRLGALTDRVAAAGHLVASLQARASAVTARVAGRPRPRVLYVLWPDPLIVPGRGALVSELIALAGGDLVSTDAGEGYPRYSLEAAVARAPEIIILASHGGGQGALGREQWERFTALPAIRAGRVYTVDGNLMHRYGPRVLDGLDRLARLIHPEAFAASLEPKSAARP